MKIELNDDSVDQYGRCLTFYVDDEGAYLLLGLVEETNKVMDKVEQYLNDACIMKDPKGILNATSRKDQAPKTDGSDVSSP